MNQSPNTKFQRREVDWEKVPFVPRPSLIADPITAFGKRKPRNEEHKSILERINREGIKPNQDILNQPIQPYISARDETRSRVLSEMRRYTADTRGAGTDKFSMDKILPRFCRYFKFFLNTEKENIRNGIIFWSFEMQWFSRLRNARE